MAEGFEAPHVPQQSRRDKLRVIFQNDVEQHSASLSHYVAPPPNSDLHPQSHSAASFINSLSSSSLFHPHPSLSINPSKTQSFNKYINTGQWSDESFQYSRHHNRPLQLNPQRCDSSLLRGLLSCGQDFSVPNHSGEPRSLVPLGPFTGYASILTRSRFLKPAQQILEDFCGVDRENCEERKCASSYLVDSSMESLRETGIVKDPISRSGRVEHRWKNLRLVSMLEEVYKRYRLYCQQMQSVVVSFEAVAGLGNAAPYICVAFKAMSKHFRCVKNAILDQIQFTGKTFRDDDIVKEGDLRLLTADHSRRGQKPVQDSNFLQYPVWRSQRGLPDHAVAVLRAWLFEHFLHPYPTDSDKQMLAQQTGLSKTQVSNWFINARVRLWKPMVEEMHALETCQAQTPSEAENQRAALQTESQITTTQKIQDLLRRHQRNELPHVPEPIEDQTRLSCSNLPSKHSYVSGGRTGGSAGISLALGLNQNDGIELSGHFPVDIVYQFGLETSGEIYLGSGFNAQNQQQLEKNIGD